MDLGVVITADRLRQYADIIEPDGDPYDLRVPELCRALADEMDADDEGRLTPTD